MRFLTMLVLLFACGSDASERHAEPETATATPTAAPTEETAQSAQTAQAEQTVQEPAEPDDDLDEHSTIRARVQRGAKTYALVERDLIAANGDATLESIAEAFEEGLGECLGGSEPIPCVAEIAPNLGFVAETASEHGRSWSLIAIENGRTVARRPLVALSLHDPSDSLSSPRLVSINMDGDPEEELLVEVPVRPLADDSLFRHATDERGSVMYVLNDELEVQARWTSEWMEADQLDDGDSPPRSDSCTRTETRESDGSISIETSCSDQDGETREYRERCRWISSTDRHRCPSGFADELFRPWSRAAPHYVGETEADLRRQLPRLFSRAVTSTSAPSTPPACAFVVDDPDPPLHVRAQRSSRSEVVGDLPNGTRLELVERRGRWARIEAPARGWIWTENVHERCE